MSNPPNNLLIPVSHEDQKYVEGICMNGAYTFQSFFVHLLNLYKKSLNNPLSIPDTFEENDGNTKQVKRNTRKTEKK